MYLDGYEFNVVWFIVCLRFSGRCLIWILSRCRRKNAKIFVKMDTESMLETSCEEGLQPEGAHCHHSETEIN